MTSIAELPSEAKCRQIIHKLILGDVRKCPRCTGALRRGNGYYWCRPCRRKVRPKALTWLYGMKLSYRQLVVLIWAWQRKQSPGAIKAFTGMSYVTIARWSWRFRQNLPVDEAMLEGVIEVDEAFFGRQRHHNQRMVLGMLERHSRRLKLVVITDRDQDTLEAELLRCIATSSQVCTDGWSSYNDLEYYGYDHFTCNHSEWEFGITNLIEGTWSAAKRQLRRMYGRLNNHRYLETFMREWEARHNFPNLFKNPTDYLQVCLVPC
jgi:IS1 family transposase/transposase-like protein